MEANPEPSLERRPLTAEERGLVRWMLEHGEADAATFLPQLEDAQVVSRCACGCASLDFEVSGLPQPSGGLRILADYLFGAEPELFGAFVFERAGVLAGIEVWSVDGNATPRVLPQPNALRPFTVK